MKSLFSFKKSPAWKSFPTPTSMPSSPCARPSSPLSETMMEETVKAAASIIKKWDPDSSSYASITSLFFESRSDAQDFLLSVKDLQRAMHFYASNPSSSDKLVRAQRLMQTAVKRLEKEFRQILAANYGQMDPDSSGRASTATRSSSADFDDCCGDDADDDLEAAADSIREVESGASLAASDLRSIADCMICSGYGMECAKIYRQVRRSIVNEVLHRLGVERCSSQRRHHHQNHLQKLDWECLEMKIKIWLNAAKISVKSLFCRERMLCDHVFAASDAIRECCFSEICKDAAVDLFRFPESVAKCKKSPERLFRLLDMYELVVDLWPETESTFSFESTSIVLSQASTSLLNLGEAIRATLADFESAIRKDSSQAPVPGGGIHPLTRYVMNYICLLGDYSGFLSDIFAEHPLQIQSPAPEAFQEMAAAEENPNAVRFEWLILVLLCRLDGKAKLYKNVALSYLFLANNLHYIVSKVQTSDLRFLVGREWISRQELKIYQYTGKYERSGWTEVLLSLPPNPKAELPLGEVQEVFRSFNSAFETACRTQACWVVADRKLREEIKVSIAGMIRPPYWAFYEKHRPLLLRSGAKTDGAIARYSPEDLDNHLSDLLYGTAVSRSSDSRDRHAR